MQATIGQRMAHIVAPLWRMVSSPLPSKPRTVGRAARRAQRQRANIMFLAVLGAVGAGVVPPAHAAPTAAESTKNTDIGSFDIQGPFLYQVLHTSKCLEPDNRSTSNSAVIEQHGCTGDLWQLWKKIDTDDGYVRIRNVHSGKCLNVQGASKANSAKVIQYTCGGSHTYNDQWEERFMAVGGGGGPYYFHLVNRHSGKCLNVQGASLSNHADLIQYTCTNMGPTKGNDWFTWF